ncbi:MAG TPA: hypothetical protein DCP31_25785, partial [Cyanobacteria bacterium UBA8543]|nr:hypothetical protein [Cyanobacteria bacterium UBA8543]
MLEVKIGSLLVGNLGLQILGMSGWLRSQQMGVSQQHQEEEEILTCFESKEDLASAKLPLYNEQLDSSSHSNQGSTDPQLVGWEFKIVRAKSDLFRNPAVFQQLCEEESKAGWILLEKLDDRRVRFKRLIALRQLLNTENLPHDPYRCYYGSTFSLRSGLGAISALLVTVIPLYFGFTLVSNILSHSSENPPA